MIDIQGREISEIETALQQMREQAQAQEALLDEYKTGLCWLDKPELVTLARSVQKTGMRRYTAKTPNYIMMGHLMTVKRRELGHEELLDQIDAMRAQLDSLKKGGN